MSQGLIAYNGGLLLVNGSLTNDPNCCCYYYGPSDCPPCCIRIDFGAFNDDGDLVGEFIADSFTIAVTIIMPTKNSRVVCDEELIEVQWGVIDDGIDSVGGFIRFGAGWIPGDYNPALPPEGIELEYGLIDWGPDLIESQYTAQFTFRECFLDSSTFLFYIDIGLTSPDFLAEIEITRCVSLTRCCPINTTCENCCALLTAADTIAYDGKYYVVSEEVDIDGTRKTTVAEINLEDAIVCIGDLVGINLFLVPSRYDPLAMANMQTANHITWERTAASPLINPIDGVTDPEFIEWGTLDEYEYSITVKAPDCTPCDNTLERFDDITFTNSIFPALTVDFTKCDQENCCDATCECIYITLSGASIPYFVPSDPPTPDGPTVVSKRRILYHAAVRDTVSTPPGGRYFTHLWIIEVCYRDIQELIDYGDFLRAWALANYPTLDEAGSEVSPEGCDIEGNSDLFLTTPDAPDEEIIVIFGPLTPTDCT